VLQHLVGVHHVVGVVVGGQRVDVPDGELGGDALPGGQRACLVQRRRRHVQPEHPAGRHAPGEVDGDGPRAATHVEDVEPRAQERQQVPR
jgi:hypothetical protein